MQARAALAQSARGRGRARASCAARGGGAVLRTARKYAMEIAANYSQPFVTFMAAAAGPPVDAAVRRRGIRARRETARDRRRRRDHLCTMPPQPHGLSAPLLCDLPQGIRRAARGRRRESQLAGDRTISCARAARSSCGAASRAHALYAAVFTKYLGFMMARGHPLEYFVEGGRSRTGRLLVAAYRHAVDDRAQLPQGAEAAGGVHARVLRLRAHRRGPHLHRRAVGPPEGEGKRSRRDQIAVVRACAASSARCTSTWASPSCSMSSWTQYNPRLARIARRGRRGGGSRRRPVGSPRLIGELAFAHRQRDQRRRRRDAHQPRLHGRARDAAPGAARGRSRAPARAVSAAAARCAVRAARHRHRRQRGAR